MRIWAGRSSVSGKVLAVFSTLAIGAVGTPAGAQSPSAQSRAPQAPESIAPQAPDQVRAVAPRQNQSAQQQREQRYQIGVMERVLESAVEHGASIIRDRLDPVLQSQTILLENARVRGFRLDDYGVFFDAEVPSLESSTTLYSVFRSLDQNGLGLQSAVKALKSYVDASGNVELEQAMRRIEVQMPPTDQVSTTADVSRRAVSGSAAVAPAARTGSDDANDPILNDPVEAFHAEVIKALTDAMLDHSGPLAIGPDEWLTVAARGIEVRPRIGPPDTNAQTFFVSVRGRDLAAFRAGQLSREDASKRVLREVRVF
jgi:hypothetical protein